MLDTTRAALTRLPVSNTHIRILEGIISFKKQLLLLLSLSLLILLLLLLLFLYTFMFSILIHESDPQTMSFHNLVRD